MSELVLGTILSTNFKSSSNNNLNAIYSSTINKENKEEETETESDDSYAKEFSQKIKQLKVIATNYQIKQLETELSSESLNEQHNQYDDSMQKRIGLFKVVCLKSRTSNLNYVFLISKSNSMDQSFENKVTANDKCSHGTKELLLCWK
jgi:hypothetical protein